MWRYLKEAFWTRVSVPLAGDLPANALAVLGFGIVGCAEHALWLIGLGLETAYLYALATNGRFQRVVDARDFARDRLDVEQTRRDLLAQLTPAARARFDHLEGKIAEVANLYRTGGNDNPLLESSTDALRQLGTLGLRLLVAEVHLQAANHQVDTAALARQQTALERELAAGGGALSGALRESKQATLELMRKRLANADRRAGSLAEIGSDLARIEAQVELALEDAGLEGRPAAVAANVRLINQILESNSALGSFEPFPGVAALTPEAGNVVRPERRTEEPGQV